MRALAFVVVLSACSVAAPDAAPATALPARAAVPTTRLALPVTGDVDCADFADGASAQRALRSGDPDRLDADRDGVACEKLRR